MGHAMIDRAEKGLYQFIEQLFINAKEESADVHGDNAIRSG
ncbi:hypothetical protein RUA8715_03440 [Ruegeria arenilitoris]|uniref:Uncharacterized protein n=1 Tax=Ruegeria arenilitoris TaxID=1173585 RepID=A0A238L087_9RHOB|nr:hypothetical protein RUA8715_03440 [Ruegeria arenilitoris]